MIALSNGLTLFGEPLVIVVLIVLIFALLETERAWTRSRRRRRLDPGTLPYLLDGLVIAAVALALASIVTQFVQGLTSLAHLLGALFERAGLLIIGAAAALVLALALARIASRRRASQNVVIASVAAGASGEMGIDAAESDSAYAPALHERFGDQPVPSLGLYQERRQPAAANAANVPTSFLDLDESGANSQARSRFAAVPALLVLALVVALVTGAVLFRDQVIAVVSGVDTSRGATATTGDGEGAIQPGAGAQPAAANVSAAVPGAESAPTAAAQAVQSAQPNDAPGTAKHVKSETLNVRALPGTDQPVVAVLAKGDAVVVFTDARLIRDTIWVKVRADTHEGWVDQSLLE
ncbi:MAG TPA: SH3 domain-containing protein [Roseiflexaceae bacterium]|nr:SH3 domain-containing protein [Roseiflexaceae bacterium]